MTPSSRDRILITGGAGFVARWLVPEVERTGAGVTLAGLGDPPAFRSDRSSWVPVDLRAAPEVRALIGDVRPTAIYHLAGVSFPPAADEAAAETFAINVVGTINLLQAVVANRSADVDPRVLIVGSGMQYGVHPAEAMPLSEDAEQRPTSTYAASKVAQEVAALQMARQYGLAVVCTRSFNHSGAGQGSSYLLPSLVRRALDLREDPARLPRLVIGNDTVRDYLHVSDAVAAYVALMRCGTPGSVYNVCRGVGLSVSELARAVLERTGVDAQVAPEPTLERPTDIPTLVGSPAKLMAATGWVPRRSHIDIIDSLLVPASSPARH